MIRRLLVICVLLLMLPASARAADEQWVEADITNLVAAFPSCGRPLIHLHADEAINAAYPGERGVLSMGRNCEVWIRSGLPRSIFRFALYHETYHATHCGCLADHSAAMDQAVKLALLKSSPSATRSRIRRGRQQQLNQRQGFGHLRGHR